MNSKPWMTIMAVILVAASTMLLIVAQDDPRPAPLTGQQLQRIRPMIRDTQAETARAQARLAECQRELTALYARYDLDETATRKLQEEIVELQRQLLTSHYRMQKVLRATVNAEQFEQLRRRLERAEASTSQGRAQPVAVPAK